MTKEGFQRLHRERRSLRRQNRTYLIIAALCLGLAASQLWRAEKNATRNEALQTTITELQASVTAFPVAVNGLNYALRSEQAKAGGYEAKWLDRVEKLASARRYIGYLRSKLKDCTATTNMLGDEGWTGNADIKPEASE